MKGGVGAQVDGAQWAKGHCYRQHAGVDAFTHQASRLWSFTGSSRWTWRRRKRRTSSTIDFRSSMWACWQSGRHCSHKAGRQMHGQGRGGDDGGVGEVCEAVDGGSHGYCCLKHRL